MFPVSLVTVVAALVVIVVAVALAETTLVYIALGLAGAGAGLLVTEVVRHRESLGISELLGRTRPGSAAEAGAEVRTDGLGKASVPVAPTMATAAARRTDSGNSVRIPAPAEEPVRGAVSDTEEVGPAGTGVSAPSDGDVTTNPEEAAPKPRAGKEQGIGEPAAEPAAVDPPEEPADEETAVAEEIAPAEAASPHHGGTGEEKGSTLGVVSGDDAERSHDASVETASQGAGGDAAENRDEADAAAGVEQRCPDEADLSAQAAEDSAEVAETTGGASGGDPGEDTDFSSFVERLKQNGRHDEDEADAQPAPGDAQDGPTEEESSGDQSGESADTPVGADSAFVEGGAADEDDDSVPESEEAGSPAPGDTGTGKDSAPETGRPNPETA